METPADNESGPAPDLSPCSWGKTYVVNEDADEVEAPSASDADAASAAALRLASDPVLGDHGIEKNALEITAMHTEPVNMFPARDALVESLYFERSTGDFAIGQACSCSISLARR